MQLIDRGRIKIEDVASQIETSEDLLSASLAVMLYVLLFFLPRTPILYIFIKI